SKRGSEEILKASRSMGNGQWAIGNGQWARKQEGKKAIGKEEKRQKADRKQQCLSDFYLPFTIHHSPFTSYITQRKIFTACCFF
ncbi:MAG TPA: hypothetical protein PLY34_06495, partial [Ferruginibacter sp.]|nr:hypothetical protein [Ferruginibacter sp.]